MLNADARRIAASSVELRIGSCRTETDYWIFTGYPFDSGRPNL